jgi:hypothetical protein
MMAGASAGPSSGRSRTARRHCLTAAALLVFTASCASKEAELDPHSVKQVVLKSNVKETPPGPDAAAKAAQAQASLATAQAAWASGDALSTLAIVNSALLKGVPSELDPAFRELRSKARAAVVATKVCRVRAIATKDAVADGDEIVVRFEFVNLSGATLRIPRAQAGTSDALVVLQLVREDFDVYGNARSSDFTLPVPVEEDLVLEPGRAHETKFTIPEEMAKLTHQGLSVIRLGGSFRPVAIRVGDTELFDAIPIEKATVRVFMKGYEPLAADPLGSLKRAVERRSPPHVLTAAELLTPGDRPAAKSFLLTAKAKDEAMTGAVDAALARIAALDAGR